MNRVRGFAGAISALLLLGLTAPATAQETSSLTVDGIAISGGFVSVAGTASFADDLVGPVEVWSDAEGDAVVPGAGLDITGGTIATNLASKQVIFKMNVADGVGPINGSPPATGFQWPISADGQNFTRWLGAGNQGSNQSLSEFTSLCNNETETGGWTCPTPLSGSHTAEGITWNMPFFRMKPQVDFGSTIEAGGILCNVPCSMAWPPGLVGSLAPTDTGAFPDTYVIPGEIRLGVAPVGTPEPAVSYTATGSLNSSATGFTGSLAAPTSPGTYTLWVKTCGGLQSSQTCVIGSADFTV